MGGSGSKPVKTEKATLHKLHTVKGPMGRKIRRITALKHKNTTLYHRRAPLQGTPSMASNIPPNEAHAWAFTTPLNGSITSTLVTPLPPYPPTATQYLIGNTNSTISAYNYYGGSSGTFLDGLTQGLNNPMVAFVPHKIYFLPMQPSTFWNNNQSFDWKLVAIGNGTYEDTSSPSSSSTYTTSYNITTALAMDPFTGQLKRNAPYTSGTNMLRYTFPYSNQTNAVQTATINPAGMVYHPTFGLMAYGPIINPITTYTVYNPRNPFQQDPANGKSTITSSASGKDTNYGDFVPDMSGVSFGNVVQQSTWVVAPSCDWDMKHLPGYYSLVQSMQSGGSFPSMSPQDILTNMCEFKMSDFVQTSTIYLVNGTSMVDTVPELGTGTTYGLIACGYSSGSVNTGLGVPTGNTTFSMFINLYYYYDDSLYPTWPDACGVRPVTSGWMMPRNFNNSCGPQSPVSGASTCYTCPPNPVFGGSPAIGSGPYPIMGNKSAQNAASCLCADCGAANTAYKVAYFPCMYGPRVTYDSKNINIVHDMSLMSYPFQYQTTYPDDPTHVAYVPDICAPTTTNAVNTFLDNSLGSYMSAGYSGTAGAIPAGANFNYGGQFITWFDTSTNAANPTAMQIVQSTVFVLGMSQGVGGGVPYLYKLQLFDLDYQKPTNVVGPTTTLYLLSVTNLNTLLNGYNADIMGNFSDVSISSVTQMQIVDFGATGNPFPVLTLLCTLDSNTGSLPGSYPAVGPLDNNTAGTPKAGPAILTFYVDLTTTLDPTLMEVDWLNAHNNQNGNAMLQATNNPLVRGLVKTNLSVPSLAVVSEATNNGASYCKTNPTTGSGRGVCDAMTIGDPVHINTNVISIEPPASTTDVGAVVTAGTPSPMTWDQTTNAALLSHVKMYTPFYRPVFNLVHTESSKLLSISAGDYNPGAQVWLWDPVNPSTNTDYLWMWSGYRLACYYNPNVGLGLVQGEDDETFIGLVHIQDAYVFQYSSSGLQELYSKGFLTPIGTAPFSNGTLLTLGAADPWTTTEQTTSFQANQVLGPTTTPPDYSTSPIVVPDNPSLSLTPLYSAANMYALQQKTVPYTQAIYAGDVLTGLQTAQNMYTGWSYDIVNRIRSQFRGQVIRPNLYGPVAQVLSFFPTNLLVSGNTDPDVKNAATIYTSVPANPTTTSQQVLGYVLSWVSTDNKQAFLSYPTPYNYEGTGVLTVSQITPIYGPLMSVAPNVVNIMPNVGQNQPYGSIYVNWVEPAYGPVQGLAQGVLQSYKHLTDPGIQITATNGNTDSNKLVFLYSYTLTDDRGFSYYDMVSNTKKTLPRVVNPITGLTSCSFATKNAATAADTDDYDSLKWIAQFMGTTPLAAPSSPFGSQGIVGHRSMMGLYPGNLNIVGPGAFYAGNDQNLIGYGSAGFVSQVNFGNNTMPNSNGFYFYTADMTNSTSIPSVAGARCQ